MGRAKKGGIKYTEKLCTNLPVDVRKAVDEYCKDEGVSEAVLGRKAVVFFLKEKEFLDKDKNYL